MVDRPAAGKAGSLNAGDAVLTEFPRIYLDADIVSPAGAVAALADVLLKEMGESASQYGDEL